MNLTNRIAQEAHDNAKSYYDRSQEYGYKFLMTLKEKGDGMTRFETSDHAKLLDKLDKKDDRRIEYWSKRND